MSFTHDGASSAVQQTRETRDASGVLTIEQRTEGLRTTLNGLVPAVGPYSLSPLQGPAAELTVEYGGSTTPQEETVQVTFQFRVQTSRTLLQEHPNYAEAIAAMDDEDKRNTEKWLTGGEIDSLPAALADAPLDEYVSKRLAGVENYLRPEPVLVSQATYQSTSGFRPSIAAAGCVYSTDDVIDALQIEDWDEDLADALPEGEWLAEDVDYSFNSTGQRVLSQAFRFAPEWDPDLYEHPENTTLIDLL